MTTYNLNSKEYRKFMRRMKASSMCHWKTGADMGIYGVKTGPVPTPNLADTIRRIIKDLKAKDDFGKWLMDD